GSGQIIASGPGAVDRAILASCNQLDTTVKTGGINLFAHAIDTRTRGADVVFDFLVEYDFGKIDWSIGATYNDTTVTKYATTPALLAGVVDGLPTNEVYDPQAYSELTTANPKYIVNLGANYTYQKFSVMLLEKIYGPASEYENDDGDNGGTGPGTFPACVPKPGTLFICPGGFDYFQTKI